jgi:imidazolonepropionase
MRLATLTLDRPGLGTVEHSAVAAKNGRIAFAGPVSELPTGWDAKNRIGLDGRWVTPGLIDCHTHLVYARRPGPRVRATPRRHRARGGGILSTVKSTRAARADDLVAASLARLDRLIGEGVTTVEIKSGRRS